MFEQKDIQLGKYQIEAILYALRSVSTPQMLVFGCGNDTPFWIEHSHYALFLETNEKWYTKVLKHCQSMPNLKNYDIKQYSIDTTIDKALEEYNNNNIMELPIPECINKEIPYNIILVDGPAGYKGNHIGRSMPICWASKLANSNTHVFIDDFNRKLETLYTNYYFPDRYIEIVDKTHKSRKTTMAWVLPTNNQNIGV